LTNRSVGGLLRDDAGSIARSTGEGVTKLGSDLLALLMAASGAHTAAAETTIRMVAVESGGRIDSYWSELIVA
jgi:hypothetical protein